MYQQISDTGMASLAASDESVASASGVMRIFLETL
jgi:hypothetical protein